MIGKPKPVEGVSAGALRFDGRHDYIILEDTNTLDFSKATFAISAWVNVYAMRAEQQMIVAKNVYSADQREWGLMLDSDRRFRFYQRSEGRWKTIQSQTTPEPGHWYQVAVTEESGQACLYVNGRCEGRADLGSPLTPTTAPGGAIATAPNWRSCRPHRWGRSRP